MQRLFISLPSDTSYITALEKFYYTFMDVSTASLTFNEDDIFLSLIEGTVNGMKHGNKFDIEKKVDIAIAVDGTKIEVIIEDNGDGFEPDRVLDPTSPDRLPMPGGRGVFLIKKLMDEVHFEFVNGGTRLIMIKFAQKS